MLADRGYDGDWYRDALQVKGVTPCIPGRKSRIMPIKYDKRRYRSRTRIEITLGRLKDCRRVAVNRPGIAGGYLVQVTQPTG